MSTCEILDTFPTFLNIWREVANDEIDKQIDAWLEKYMSAYPELLQKQFDDYARLQENWQMTTSG